MQAPGGIVFRRAQSLSKKGKPFINGEEGCVRETRTMMIPIFQSF